jgi:hypothetical protein
VLIAFPPAHGLHRNNERFGQSISQRRIVTGFPFFAVSSRELSGAPPTASSWLLSTQNLPRRTADLRWPGILVRGTVGGLLRADSKGDTI